MSVDILQQLAEVSPGQFKRIGDMTVQDAEGAADVCRRSAVLEGELQQMLAKVGPRGLAVPADLKRRLTAGPSNLPELLALRDELRAALADEAEAAA